MSLNPLKKFALKPAPREASENAHGWMSLVMFVTACWIVAFVSRGEGFWTGFWLVLAISISATAGMALTMWVYQDKIREH